MIIDTSGKYIARQRSLGYLPFPRHLRVSEYNKLNRKFDFTI